MSEFQVARDDILRHRIAARPQAALSDGQIRVALDRFSVTSNNVTYAQVGARMRYWDFFPASGAAEGWGLIPVWGFGDVVESCVEEVPVGDRLYGYFPPARDVVLHPVKVTAGGLVDGAAHRAELPGGYNLYQRVLAEPGYDRAGDDLRALLWPLLITSFCLWDAAKSADWFGAARVVVLSASSKTSLGLAHALRQDPDAPPVIGLTSARHVRTVRGTALYDDVLSYDAAAALSSGTPTLIVDMSGNGRLLSQLHARLGDAMCRTINVGLTHREEIGKQPGFLPERSAFFFAPAHIQGRIAEWGADGFAARSQAFLTEATARLGGWLTIRHLDGLEALADRYPALVRGEVPAQEGTIVRLGPGDAAP